MFWRVRSTSFAVERQQVPVLDPYVPKVNFTDFASLSRVISKSKRFLSIKLRYNGSSGMNIEILHGQHIFIIYFFPTC
jgi:hypothetical protein